METKKIIIDDSKIVDNFFLKLILKKKTEGIIKIVIVIKLKANKPIWFSNWSNSVAQEKLYAQRFHGKPVRTFALIKSDKAKLPDKRNIEGTFNFKYGPIDISVKEINKLKNKGIKINPKGIKILKFSSNVSEFTIQCNPLR